MRLIGSELNMRSVTLRHLHLSRAKLKASSRTSALLSGFAMVALVEIQLTGDEKSKPPTWLLILFAVCTTLLISVHLLALMISTCILPHVEAAANAASSVPNLDAAHHNYSPSPHQAMRWYIELSWAFSTVVGILLFLVEIVLICWVQFHSIAKSAAIAATCLIVPISLVFCAFAVHFYNKLADHKFEGADQRMRDLEQAYREMEEQAGGGAGGGLPNGLNNVQNV